MFSDFDLGTQDDALFQTPPKMKEDEIYEIETKLNCKSNSTLISIFNILDDETYEEMRTFKK